MSAAGLKSSKSEEIQEQPLPNLPDDVIVEILVKLPVKSLLQLRRVCKTWYSLISDPKLFNLQTVPPCVLICDGSKFDTITIESFLSETATTPTPTPLFVPWESGYQYFDFLGSSKGLICVDDSRRGLILWNPSIGKFRRLPSARHSDNCYQSPYAGFYYDESVEDYKLVWVNLIGDSTGSLELDVFTLKSNTWRRNPRTKISVGVFNRCGGMPISGVHFNGSFHWVVEYYDSSLLHMGTRILALDLATEDFRVVALPRDSLEIKSIWIRSLGGRLCFCAPYTNECGDGGIDLWMMNEHGVESSWTKLVSLPDRILPVNGLCRFYPLLFSNEDEILAVFYSWNGGEIVKFNIRDRVVKLEPLLCVPNDPSHIFSEGFLKNNVVLHRKSLEPLADEQHEEQEEQPEQEEEEEEQEPEPQPQLHFSLLLQELQNML